MLVFLAIALGGGLLIGTVTAPGPWYQQLEKPAFNPPAWVFGPVWTFLYVLIGIAGARVWARDLRSPSRLWLAQMGLNFLWSPLFFSAHRPDLALLIIVLLLIAIVLFVGATWRRDRASALLFLPYLAWIAFATALNFAIWRLNG
ncbi:tryptophan-rich sensory protein [Pseudohoeflea sp. DP4N28-3]|uniref:Tryptophan-rich sensory protein n=2 Tax=Pseudohoeflea coraliihabitans TaxID=2860393 RepID=A0ABS6WSW0_9HYPH|nr:TspO/MBR family protein [Pseudohoeflea sp. DP4N28-3]MBW3099058.1 tryptophan-rich sensory protein [Pseudohoeflea sp. DP4N28-3]